MKFLVKSIKLEDAKKIIRSSGYALIFDRKSGQESLVRRLGGGHYPRFHLYIEENNEDCIFSLHLDQKRASYEGQHMHSAEYDGDLVENEIQSLSIIVGNNNYSVLPFGKKHQINQKIDKQEKEEIIIEKKNDDPENDILADMECGDLDRDLDNFQKNIKKKRFLFF